MIRGVLNLSTRMSERGESLDPVRMLNVASWRKLRASRRRVQRGLESQNLRPPNMQRTRALASLGTLTSFARSPLTRHPLGRTRGHYVTFRYA